MTPQSVVGVACYRCATLLPTSTDSADLLLKERAVAKEADDNWDEAGMAGPTSRTREDAGGRSRW
ncbi:hypothetical protein ACLOJK_036968 [Asimina triloba]